MLVDSSQPRLAVLATGAQHLEAQLALELGIPVIKQRSAASRKDEAYDYWLRYTADGLELEPVDASSGAVRVDFAAGKARHRRVYGGGKGQQIAKAVGVQGSTRPTVLDLTAGLGGDAFVLASLGCRVFMVERQPIVRALLADGLERGELDVEAADVVASMTLKSGDALSAMSAWIGDAPQVIYLDPMFPHSKKSAQVKKEMAVFRLLVGADADADALLEPAMALATHRVVVKRPRLAPDLAGQKPTYRLEGKANRFDVYVRQSFSTKV